MPLNEKNQKPDLYPSNYLSFLLRLSKVEDKAEWRATLQVLANGEQISFASLTELFNFLQKATSQNIQET